MYLTALNCQMSPEEDTFEESHTLILSVKTLDDSVTSLRAGLLTKAGKWQICENLSSQFH
jgi:hypothetical protein